MTKKNEKKSPQKVTIVQNPDVRTVVLTLVEDDSSDLITALESPIIAWGISDDPADLPSPITPAGMVEAGTVLIRYSDGRVLTPSPWLKKGECMLLPDTRAAMGEMKSIERQLDWEDKKDRRKGRGKYAPTAEQQNGSEPLFGGDDESLPF